MQAYTPMRRRGFTLVELLTVVAIIALLIGLLVPTVGKVRDHAKYASVQTMLEVISKGCEMFNKDFDRYPRSAGQNPFETNSYQLSGAQWLILQLSGADLQGFAARDKDHEPASPAEWVAAYDPNSPLRRWGPDVQLEGKTVQTPTNYAQQAGLTLPAGLIGGSSDYKNENLPMAIDVFGFPVLYYAANVHAKQPFSEWNGTTLKNIGRYSQRDNEAITGSKDSGVAGFDLGGGEVQAGQYHWLYELGWSSGTTADQPPKPQTFAEKFYDRELFQQKGGTTGKVWPRRPDTFLLISPGKDGIYGTSDDVTNF